ncbi:MAG: hypothetical protein U1A81_04180 [Hydrogenophaga sp.]|nr:hypothetical protein [Hydrogenophaga sp.]
MAEKHLTLLDATPELPSTLNLRFADGVCMRVDISGLIEKRAAVFEVLRNPETFMRAQTGLGVESSVGWWGPDDRLRFSPFELRAAALHQATGRSPWVVSEWMTRHQLTVSAAAEMLGVARGTVRYYLSGKKPVPRKVVLAIQGLEGKHQVQKTGADLAPHELLSRWLKRHKLVHRLGAAFLGVSPRMLAYYLKGEKPIPKKVMLAMHGWDGVNTLGVFAPPGG